VLLRFNHVFSPQVAYAVLGLTAFTFLMTTLFIVMRKNTEDVSYFVGSQVVYDILFTTALTYYTGTNESIYVTYYLINIMFTAVLLNGTAAIVAAMASGGFYFMLAYFSSDNFSGERSYLVMTTETSFIVVALLTGQLVDEIKRTKARIGRLERLSDEIIESLDAGLLGFNDKKIVTRINKTAKILLNLGQSPIGRSVYDVFPAMREITLESLPSDRFVKSSMHRVRVSGVDRRFLVSLISLNEKSSMILFRDLTEILELEEQLKVNQHLASVGSLAASLAHEIRNPIASISGAAQLLTNKDIAQEESKRLSALIVRETERVDLLIKQLLQFAKSEPIHKDIQCNGKDIVNECVEAFKARSDYKDYPVSIIANSPETDSAHDRNLPYLVAISSEALTEVVSNLIINSYQAMLDARVNINEARIKIDLLTNGEQIDINVTDSGPGISIDTKDKIFEPFFTTKSYGTGLGLARVHKIVKDYGGQIELQSPVEHGRGTTFKVKLPKAA
jgi:two-component system sensor histidine kinase PilS (NtrC family)